MMRPSRALADDDALHEADVGGDDPLMAMKRQQQQSPHHHSPHHLLLHQQQPRDALPHAMNGSSDPAAASPQPSASASPVASLASLSLSTPAVSTASNASTPSSSRSSTSSADSSICVPVPATSSPSASSPRRGPPPPSSSPSPAVPSANGASPSHSTQSPLPASPLLDARNLYVDNLPSLSDVELRNLFLPYGPILKSRVAMDPTTRLPSGYGFVMFEKAEDALKAIEGLNAHVLGTKRLRVTIKKPKPNVASRPASSSTPPAASSSAPSAASTGSALSSLSSAASMASPSPLSPQSVSPPGSALCNLYVSGLPVAWTKSDVDALFSACGRVADSRVLLDRTTGKSRGIAMLRYEQRQAAQAAIAALHQRFVPPTMHRAISVKHANEKPQQQSPQPSSSSSSPSSFSSSSSPSMHSSSSPSTSFLTTRLLRDGLSPQSLGPPRPTHSTPPSIRVLRSEPEHDVSQVNGVSPSMSSSSSTSSQSPSPPLQHVAASRLSDVVTADGLPLIRPTSLSPSPSTLSSPLAPPSSAFSTPPKARPSSHRANGGFPLANGFQHTTPPSAHSVFGRPPPVSPSLIPAPAPAQPGYSQAGLAAIRQAVSHNPALSFSSPSLLSPSYAPLYAPYPSSAMDMASAAAQQLFLMQAAQQQQQQHQQGQHSSYTYPSPARSSLPVSHPQPPHPSLLGLSLLSSHAAAGGVVTGASPLQSPSLYCYGLPSAMTEADLRDLFSIYGAVSSVHVMKNDNGTPKGYAFVNMRSVHEAEMAVLYLDHFAVGGRVLRVQFKKPGGGGGGGAGAAGAARHTQVNGDAHQQRGQQAAFTSVAAISNGGPAPEKQPQAD